MLLESYRRDADLTEIGSKMNRFFVRNALVARLVSEAAWKQYPQHADVTIERPIFVTGSAAHRHHRHRTGCSALTRDTRVWSCGSPSSRSRGRHAKPGRRTRFSAELDARFTKAHNENPDYTGLHFMTADEVEECWQLLRQSLHSVSYETLAHLPTYSQWLAEQDWIEAVSAAPQEPSADRPQRRREALGVEEPEPPVRARRVDGRLPRCAGGAVPPAGGDDHGVDVLAGPAHHRGLVEQLQRRVDRAGRDGDVVARPRAVQRRTGQT